MRLLLSIIIAIFLASCTPEPKEPEKLVVGTVSGGVHEELLTIVSGKLDANYFQHIPFMDEYNAENDPDGSVIVVE